MRITTIWSMGTFYLPPESDNLNEVPASFTRLSYVDDKVTYLGDSVSNINLHVDTNFRNMRACVTPTSSSVLIPTYS
jgi:hypothetical protein